MATISAVVKDNVWLTQEMFNLYPNIYVMFHADSGLKKGPPVNVAKRLVKEVGNTKVISGRSSIQGILKKLGSGVSQPGGKVAKSSSAFICSSELSSSIVDDKAATDILTDLYDRSYNADDWDSLLKAEEFVLKDATLTMLTATNEAHSSGFFERKDVAGGFFARTFVIYENEENRPNSLIVVRSSNPTGIDYKALAEYLHELAMLGGPFVTLGSDVETEHHTVEIFNEHDSIPQFFTPAGAIYENWYNKFKVDAKKVKDPTGTLNRFGASVLKVAMILALAERPVLEISETAMEQAISMCEKLVGNIRKVTFGRAEGDVSDAGRKKILLLELMNRYPNPITNVQLNKTFWMQGTYKEWEETVISLAHANVIEVNQLNPNTLTYTMKESAYHELKAVLEGKTI